MKCFIHSDIDAVATCKNCGKAMCVNCSAYSEHKGVCPVCRKEEFEKEWAQNEKKKLFEILSVICTPIIGVVASVLLTKVLVWLFLVPMLITIIVVLCAIKKIQKLAKRGKYLLGEIMKLNAALSQGGMGI